MVNRKDNDKKEPWAHMTTNNVYNKTSRKSDNCDKEWMHLPRRMKHFSQMTKLKKSNYCPLHFIFTYYSSNVPGNNYVWYVGIWKTTCYLFCTQFGIILLWKTTSAWQSAFRFLFKGSRVITLKPKGQPSVRHC